jgi:hypothetical protein
MSLKGTCLTNTCHITVQSRNSMCHQTYLSQKNLHQTYCLQNNATKNPILPVPFRLSCSDCNVLSFLLCLSRSLFPVLPVPLCLSRSGCLTQAVLFWLSFPIFLPRLSYPSSPVLVALSGQSYPGSPIRAVLSWHPCPGSPFLAVLLAVWFCLS